MNFLLDSTTITFVRHGETNLNTQKCYFGHLNPTLNLNGNIQAEKTTKLLKHETFNIIYSSDLTRCVKTGEIINSYHKLNIITSDNLREKNFGIFEGKTYEEVKNEFPKEADQYFKDWKNYIIPEGESLDIMQKRCVKAVEKIITEHKSKSILIITHSGVIKALLAYYLCSDLDGFWRYQIDYASMTKLVFNPDGYVYAEYINRI